MDRTKYILVAITLLYLFKDRLPGHLFRLPGDIQIHNERFRFLLPFTTCLILSIVISFALALFGRR